MTLSSATAEHDIVLANSIAAIWKMANQVDRARVGFFIRFSFSK
jgi:hypothetical protein